VDDDLEALPANTSVMPQGDRWLDPQSPPRRDLARDQRDQNQHGRRARQRHGIVRRDADELRRDARLSLG